MNKTNYILAATPEEDLAIVKTMASELKNYLLRDDVYFTIEVQTPAGSERIQMSSGDLLSRLRRLVVQKDRLTDEQRSELEAVQKEIADVTRAMRKLYVPLLIREAKARLSSLKWFLDECRDNRRYCRSEYPYEIRNRQRLTEVLGALGDDTPDDIKRSVAEIDRRIGSVAQPADFVWDERVQDVYPRDKYWYLYMLPA
jgi:septal ring factor EnvC (AmiA/AmiB activator)